MPGQASSVRAVRVRAVPYFGRKHRLAAVAAGWCANHRDGAPPVAGVVCGACWERAVRDDERLFLDNRFDPMSLPHAPARSSRHLGPGHVLAGVAASLCRRHVPVWPVIAQVACGPCWEYAIRRDEAVVTEFGLAREQEPDPSYVDEAAVRLAVAGEPVELTPAEAEQARQVRQGLVELAGDDGLTAPFTARVVRRCVRRVPRRVA